MKQQIPVIDLTDARSGDRAARLRLGQEIDRTCTEIGFFTITGHGVPSDVIRASTARRTSSSPCRWRRSRR